MIDSKRQWRMACEWNVRTRILRSCTQSRHIFRILYGHITVALASLPRSIYYGSGVAAEQTIFPMTTTTRERILAWSEEHVFFPSFFIFIFYFPALFSRIAAKTSSISRSRSYTIDVTLAIFFNAIFFFFFVRATLRCISCQSDGGRAPHGVFFLVREPLSTKYSLSVVFFS